MNAREHADTAAHLAEQAQRYQDDGNIAQAGVHSSLAKTHALTSIALSMTTMPVLLPGTSLVDELAPGPNG